MIYAQLFSLKYVINMLKTLFEILNKYSWLCYRHSHCDTTKPFGGMINEFLGHLSHSGDLLLWVGVWKGLSKL